VQAATGNSGTRVILWSMTLANAMILVASLPGRLSPPRQRLPRAGPGQAAIPTQRSGTASGHRRYQAGDPSLNWPAGHPGSRCGRQSSCTPIRAAGNRPASRKPAMTDPMDAARPPPAPPTAPRQTDSSQPPHDSGAPSRAPSWPSPVHVKGLVRAWRSASELFRSTRSRLLAGQVTWRRLFPAGLVTAICYTGVGIYVAFFGSSSILSNEASYGPIGAVMTLLTIEVGLGVALHLGAVIGATIGGKPTDEPSATRPRLMRGRATGGTN
jgi:hypothetical protein